jgi:hypothetical protein
MLKKKTDKERNAENEALERIISIHFLIDLNKKINI